MRICASVSTGAVNITMWYVFAEEEIHKNMPSKSESDEVAEMIRTAKERMAEFMERQVVLAGLEQEVLKQNNSVDEGLVLVTVLESLGILVLAVVEVVVLSKFISRKELF